MEPQAQRRCCLERMGTCSSSLRASANCALFMRVSGIVGLVVSHREAAYPDAEPTEALTSGEIGPARNWLSALPSTCPVRSFCRCSPLGTPSWYVCHRSLAFAGKVLFGCAPREMRLEWHSAIATPVTCAAL